MSTDSEDEFSDLQQSLGDLSKPPVLTPEQLALAQEKKKQKADKVKARLRERERAERERQKLAADLRAAQVRNDLVNNKRNDSLRLQKQRRIVDKGIKHKYNTDRPIPFLTKEEYVKSYQSAEDMPGSANVWVRTSFLKDLLDTPSVEEMEALEISAEDIARELKKINYFEKEKLQTSCYNPPIKIVYDTRKALLYLIDGNHRVRNALQENISPLCVMRAVEKVDHHDSLRGKRVSKTAANRIKKFQYRFFDLCVFVNESRNPRLSCCSPTSRPNPAPKPSPPKEKTKTKRSRRKQKEKAGAMGQRYNNTRRSWQRSSRWPRGKEVSLP